MTLQEKLPKNEQEWIESAVPEEVIVSTNSESDEARFELICAELAKER